MDYVFIYLYMPGCSAEDVTKTSLKPWANYAQRCGKNVALLRRLPKIAISLRKNALKI